jgi:hypothetical protein
LLLDGLDPPTPTLPLFSLGFVRFVKETAPDDASCNLLDIFVFLFLFTLGSIEADHNLNRSFGNSISQQVFVGCVVTLLSNL